MRWYPVTDPPGTEPIRLPSVTTVLDLTMPQARRDTLVRSEMTDPANYHKRRSQALSKGTAVDEWAKRCLTKRQIYGCPHPVERQCQRLLPLLRGIIKAGGDVWTDEVVHSIPLGYAGTLDIVATLPGGLMALIELKTSAYTIWPEAVAEARLQAAGYYLARSLMYPHLKLTAIATYHVTPYRIHEQVISDPAELARAVSDWKLRLKQFASRFNALEV